MKVLIDNNVVLDVFQNREPFVESSSAVLRLIETKQIRGYVTANSSADIYYVLNRSLKDIEKTYAYMHLLFSLIDVINATKNDINEALRHNVHDFEDQLICVCAKGANMDFIITRNIMDFVDSKVPAVTSEDFLTKYYPEN